MPLDEDIPGFFNSKLRQHPLVQAAMTRMEFNRTSYALIASTEASG
jgi:hypothetical protein